LSASVREVVENEGIFCALYSDLHTVITNEGFLRAYMNYELGADIFGMESA